MLEKIGLPPKPSLRGNNWVVDATHCQGCSSQFTLINRKHHCRRCGGLFCNSCTQQRMVLRGQGDSPVRICEPCKKLEEASRFEMRFGRNRRTGKVGSKLTAKNEEEVSPQVFSNEEESSMSSRSASNITILSRDQLSTSSASCLNINEITSKDEKGGLHRNLSNDQPTSVSTATPEELREQAAEEKKKYKTLKAEGKPEEALRAFKRGKELEREAEALVLTLRKNRRKASSFSDTSELPSIKNDAKTSSSGSKRPPQMSKEKDDFAAELRELGWSDMDFHDADKKPAAMTLEGELSNLLGEVSQRENTEKGTLGIDKSQVIAHKRKALELKHQGKLVEAKEELKRAKVLEKQIEEQELLGEDEDSDEEFSSLMRSTNFDKHNSLGYNLDHGFDFDNFGGHGDDLGTDGELEVTQEDMNDPDMLAALQSIGWAEETTLTEDVETQFEASETEVLLNEIQSLKKEALNQKRAGNSKEALTLFRKAKLLEQELDSANSRGTNVTAESYVIKSGERPANQIDANVRSVNESKETNRKTAVKSKSMIQKELLGLKRKALAFRREGKFDEAEEELKKGKVLEKQLEELENAPKVTSTKFSDNQTADSIITDIGDEEVTDQDMSDPAYLSLLKTLGWNDDANENLPPSSSKMDVPSGAHIDGSSNIQAMVNLQAGASRKSKSEIQRELLGLKRKSLALRRQGEFAEAEEVLKTAQVLEAQLAEIEAPSQKEIPVDSSEHEEDDVLHSSLPINSQPSLLHPIPKPPTDLGSTGFMTAERPKEMIKPLEKQSVLESTSLLETNSQNDGHSLQQDILAHKKKAVALKREGKLAEAKDELRKAKLVEKHLEEIESEPNPSFSELSGSDVSFVGGKDSTHYSGPKPLVEAKEELRQAKPLDRRTEENESNRELSGVDVSFVGKKDSGHNSGSKPLSTRDRFKLQQESLKHMRQAHKLQREGRTEEAEAELELAQALKSQLGESATQDSATEAADEVVVEDFLDPQLSSALKAIGLDDASSGSRGPEKHEPKKQIAPEIGNSDEERVQLEQQIKAEKVKALNLKRSGKQAEALDALRRAKVLEKKLNSLPVK